MEQENKLRRNTRDVLQEFVSEKRKDLQEGKFSLNQPLALETPIWNKVLKYYSSNFLVRARYFVQKCNSMMECVQ
jgi:hypothetical protein